MARTTERSLLEIYSLIEQASAGKISLSLIDLLRIANSSYAGLFVTDGGDAPQATQSFGLTPKKLRLFRDKGPEHFARAGRPRQRLVVERNGVFAVFFQLSFESTTNTEWHFHARVNGEEIDRIGARRTTRATPIAIGSVSAFGHAQCKEGDYFEIFIDASSANREMILHEGQFGMHQIG